MKIMYQKINIVVKILSLSLFFWNLIDDLFYSGDSYDMRIFLGIIMGFIIIFLFGLKSKAIFLFSIILFLEYINETFFVHNLGIAERVATWLYLFLCTGVVVQLYELHKRVN